jgi:hypothetical protein
MSVESDYFDYVFEETYQQFTSHMHELEVKPLECALASFIRFVERKYGFSVQVDFISLLDTPHPVRSFMVASENRVMYIYLSELFRHTSPDTDPERYHVACGLIAHELAHLILQHASEFRSFRTMLGDKIEQADIEAFMNIVDFDATMYSSILLGVRSPVFEREYYYKEHPFIANNQHERTFSFGEFRAGGGFPKVLVNLEQRNQIRAPHTALAPILNEVLGAMTEGENVNDLAAKVVRKYRSPAHRHVRGTHPAE